MVGTTLFDIDCPILVKKLLNYSDMSLGLVFSSPFTLISDKLFWIFYPKVVSLRRSHVRLKKIKMCTVKNNFETIVFPLTLKQNKILKQFQQIWALWEAIPLWYDFYENQRRLILFLFFYIHATLLINIWLLRGGPHIWQGNLAGPPGR